MLTNEDLHLRTGNLKELRFIISGLMDRSFFVVIFLMFTKDGKINKITLSHLYSRGGEEAYMILFLFLRGFRYDVVTGKPLKLKSG